MAISYVGVGASATGTTTITPAYPGGTAAGQLAVLQVVSGHPDDSIPSTPSGWTLAGTFSGGGGTFGSGTGPRRLTWFMRVLLTASDDAPTTTLASGTGAVLAGRIHVLSRSAGTDWRWASAFGEDTTSDTAYSAVCVETPTWAVGDVALLGYALPVSTASLTAEAIAATGITFGAVTEQADDAVATGNAARLAAATCSVTSGSGTQAPTISATLAVASTGAAGVLRIREASAAITATAQTVSPPRTLVSVTGMAAEDIVAATIYRLAGTVRTAVRAASAVDVTAQDALLRVDAEQPFGVAVSYEAELEDIAGTVWTVATSSTITSTVSSDVISDAIRGVGAAVRIVSWPDKKRDRDGTQFNVGGRIVVVSRPRSSASATVTVRTETDDAGESLQDVLDEATEGVILIRAQTSLSGVDGYLVVLTDTEDRNWYDQYRRWALDSVETEAWPDVLEAAGFTLQDIADNFTSLQDLADFFTPGSLLGVAQHDFGA